MAFILVSNFFCWFPVIIIGILASLGKPVPGAAYSWTAVVVLPLNSATNPVIYTLLQFIPNLMQVARARKQNMAMSVVNGGHGVGGGGGGGHHPLTRIRARPPMVMIMPRDANSSVTGLSTGRERSESLVMLMRPPPGFITLNEFIRNQHPLTTQDMLDICYSLSKNLKEFHEVGYVLGKIDFDNIFVSQQRMPVGYVDQEKREHDQQGSGNESDDEADQDESDRGKGKSNAVFTRSLSVPPLSMNHQDQEGDDDDDDGECSEDSSTIVDPQQCQLTHPQSSSSSSNQRAQHYQLLTYVPGFNAYKVANHDEAVDDFAVDMEEFGLVVKKMLQVYHAKLVKQGERSKPRANGPPGHRTRTISSKASTAGETSAKGSNGNGSAPGTNAQ